MTGIPVVLHLATLSQLVAIALGIAAWPRLGSAARWIVAWVVLKTAGDLTALEMAMQRENNLWLGYVVTPLQGTLVLWALSQWHQQVGRLTLRIVIPLALAAWLLLVVLMDDISTFSQAGDPLYALLGLTAALLTLGLKATGESEPLLLRDWFWISTGVALYFGTATSVSVLGAMMIGPRPDLVVNAYKVKALLDLLAFAAITGGVLCSRTRPRFGVSSSPA